MKKIFSAALFFCAGIVMVSSCKKDKGKIPITSQSFCDSLQVKYSVHIQPVIQSQCAISGCHTSGASMGDFTTYSGVKAKVDNGSFENRVLTLSNMPPVGPLPDSTKKKIDCWLKAGAPNN